MPLLLFLGFFLNIITLTLIAVNVYFIREWYIHKDIAGDDNYTMICLSVAIFCFILNFLGKSIFQLFLGKTGKDEPNQERSSNNTIVTMPEGHTIFVEFYGIENKQTLLFIHGWSSNSTQWYYHKKALSKNYKLVFIDLPGCGKSSKKKNKKYGPQEFAKEIEFLISELKLYKPIIIGHSIGGMTILNYCKDYMSSLSDKLSGIVLVQTTYTDPAKTSILSGLLTTIEKPVLRPMCHLMIAFAPPVQLMNWLQYLNGTMHITNHITGFGGTETKGQLNQMTYISATSPVDVVAAGMLGMFDYDVTNSMQNISLPVLVIAGDKDILCKPIASHFISKQIRNSTLFTLQPSGHMGPLERNDQMIMSIDSFAKKIEIAKDLKPILVQI